MKVYFLIFCLLFATIANATISQFKGCLYTVDNPTIKVTWEPAQYADYYEVQLVFLDKNSNFTIQTTNVTNITLPRPRAGHFKIRVRSCNATGKSAWSESVNALVSKVDGINSPWIIYWKLPAPVIVIE